MPTRASLLLFYSKLQQMLVPGLRNSQWVYKEFLKSVSPGVCWLDLGCGHQLLPEWMPEWEREQRAILQQCGIVVGIDAGYDSLRNTSDQSVRCSATSKGYRSKMLALTWSPPMWS
jgi:hypothetical protein